MRVLGLGFSFFGSSGLGSRDEGFGFRVLGSGFSFSFRD